ncbi:MAG: methylated-DNA--[protein]-cysteine S-methyltransferase [Deltaproteobacteria bacterium]|nr:methylated-DNA--[protein]-cysteine S-methyltransferase [Deltaproteobacteria bacterium]
MPDQDYQRIAKAIDFLRKSVLDQPSLDAAARQLGLSPCHFQRLFKRFAGVSPKRFLQHLTSEHAKQLLRQSTSVLETSFAVGLSSPSRLHDLLITVEAVTPGEYKTGGAGVQISYGIHTTPFGSCLLGLTARGVCRLEFVAPGEAEIALQRLQKAWPHARINEDRVTTGKMLEQIFQSQKTPSSLSLLLKGTNFQLKVWNALLQIPPGSVTSYGFLAKQLGQPNAARAVGTAIGNNPIGYLIPCHRVLRGDGGIGGYRWGTERKLAILGRELCRSSRNQPG